MTKSSPKQLLVALRHGALTATVFCSLACQGELEPAGPLAEAEPYGTVGSVAARPKLDGTKESYRALLEATIADAKRRLARVPSGSPQHSLHRRRAAAAREKLEQLDLAFLDYRDRLAEATASLRQFLELFAVRRDWELSYALESEDLGLAISVVEDAVERGLSTAQASPQGQVEGSLADEAGLASVGEREASLQRLAATVFLQLGLVAVERLEYGAAERSFQAAIEHADDLGVRTAAMRAYADLLAGVGREGRSQRVAAELDALLRAK